MLTDGQTLADRGPLVEALTNGKYYKLGIQRHDVKKKLSVNNV